MAFRTAVRGARRADGVIAVGGDVPPELLEDRASAFPPVLLLRGSDDDWYTAEKLKGDVGALDARGTIAHAITYDAGHVWTEDVSRAASEFVRGLIASTPRPRS
jgi:predicted esterase